MGFTRYWASKNIETFPEKFLSEVTAVLEVALEEGIELAGPFGEGTPVIESGYIGLNGPLSSSTGEDLSYESFVIDLSEGNSFNFCKTQCRPYDVVVNAVLEIAAAYDVVVNVSSDGDNEEDEARHLIEEARKRVS